MSRKRFRPTDAFVDESIRGQRYLMGCVLAEARVINHMRADLAGLVTRNRRVRFHNESPAKRAVLLQTFSELPIAAFVVSVQRRHGMTLPMARAFCLGAIVAELQQRSVSRVVIETREDDHDDVVTIMRSRARRPPLVFEHRAGPEEPMLWIADAVTWAVGAGPRWKALVAPVLWEVDEIQP